MASPLQTSTLAKPQCKLIHNYVYEAGVRQLERQIGTLIRKIAVSVAR